LALAEEVENELDAAGNAQLVVNAEEIVAHGVLAEAKPGIAAWRPAIPHSEIVV
jgi:hypothetical protein